MSVIASRMSTFPLDKISSFDNGLANYSVSCENWEVIMTDISTMKVGDFPDIEWVKETCKIGQGYECCRYLTMHPAGWSCEKHSEMKKYLDMRVSIGSMTARGDNCLGKDAR
jgi:hypothetical protein